MITDASTPTETQNEITLEAALVAAAMATKEPVNTGPTGIIDAARALLARHGLAVLQRAIYRDGHAGAETILLHCGGAERNIGELLLPTDAHSIGHTITLARSYALSALLHIATDDAPPAAMAPQAPENKPPIALQDSVPSAPEMITHNQLSQLNTRFAAVMPGLTAILAEKSGGKVTSIEQLTANSAGMLLCKAEEYLALANARTPIPLPPIEDGTDAKDDDDIHY